MYCAESQIVWMKGLIQLPVGTAVEFNRFSTNGLNISSVCLSDVCLEHFFNEKQFLISAKKKIMIRNFQDMILEVYKVHQENHG